MVLSCASRTSAAALAMAVVAASAGCSRGYTAGLWFAADALSLPDHVEARLGGPLTDAEMASIERLSRQEVERAFSGLGVLFTDTDRAFWRVAVVRSMPDRGNMALPRAGESLALGFLGGRGIVGVDFVAFKAVHYAPADGNRAAILAAIARGIGRVAIHEFMHQMLGNAIADDRVDPDSYEYGTPDRRSQYYGELHWASAMPLLRKKLGST